MADYDDALIEKAKHAVQHAFPYALPINAGVIEHYARAVLYAVADDLRAGALREAADEMPRFDGSNATSDVETWLFERADGLTYREEADRG